MKFVLILVLSSHILELVLMKFLLSWCCLHTLELALMKFVLILVLSSHILELVLMKFILILVLSLHTY